MISKFLLYEINGEDTWFQQDGLICFATNENVQLLRAKGDDNSFRIVT